MIKYINDKINDTNYKEYFDEVDIRGDGNCGVYSIIYAMNKRTTYKKYKEKKSGKIYYDRAAVTQFRQEISNIYGDKILEPNISSTLKEKYKTRQQNILTDGDWLQDDDIKFYGDRYGLCIVVFVKENNQFDFISTSQNDKYGFDGCTNTIFLINHGSKKANGSDKDVYRDSSTGVHFQVLVPKTGAQIYRNIFSENGELIYINDYGPYANDVNSSASSRNSPVPKSPFPAGLNSPFPKSRRNSPIPAVPNSHRNRQGASNKTARNTRRNRPDNIRPTRNEGPFTNLLLGSLSVLIMIAVISLQ
jgi:hypothetical protein